MSSFTWVVSFTFVSFTWLLAPSHCFNIVSEEYRYLPSYKLHKERVLQIEAKLTKWMRMLYTLLAFAWFLFSSLWLLLGIWARIQFHCYTVGWFLFMFMFCFSAGVGWGVRDTVQLLGLGSTVWKLPLKACVNAFQQRKYITIRQTCKADLL